MNHEVTKKQKLLNESGNLNEPGYSKKEVFEYDRKQIKVAKWKIKEWDYYFVGNKNYGLCLTFGDNGYVGPLAFTHLDFNTRTEIDAPDIVALPLGKFKLPNTSSIGNAQYKTKQPLHTQKKTTSQYSCKKRVKENFFLFLSYCKFIFRNSYNIIQTNKLTSFIKDRSRFSPS